MRLFGLNINKATDKPIDEPFKKFKTEISHSESTLYADSQEKPYNPDLLYKKRGNYDLFDEMREDDQVHAAITLKKNTILGTDWYIDTDDENVREFWEVSLKKYFSDDDSHTFENVLYEKLTALDYGFSMSEIVIDSVIMPELGNKPFWILKKLKTRAPHSFELHTDKYGNLSDIVQWGAVGDNLHLPKDKMMLFVHQGEFGNPYGKSDLNKSVYRSQWSKDNIIKFQNIALERFGAPLLKGTYPANTDDETKSRFKLMLKNVMSKTAFMTRDDFNIDMIGGGQTISDAFDRAIDKHNLMIARAILVPDLLGFSGSQTSSGGLGSSMGDGQINTFFSICKRINSELTALVNRRIIGPLTKANFGPDTWAELKFRSSTKEQELLSASKFTELMKSGYQPTNDQKIWLMDVIGAPTNEMEKQIEENPEGDQQPDTDKPGEIVKPKEKEPEKLPEKAKPVESKPPKKEETKEDDDKTINEKLNADAVKVHSDFSREKTEFEKKVDFKEIENDLNNLEASYIPKVADKIKAVINNLMATIEKKKIIENKKFTAINELELKGMVELRKIFKDMFRDSYKSGLVSIATLKNNSVIEIDPALDTAETVTWMKEAAIYTTNVEGAELLKVSRGTLADGIRSGSGTKEIMKMLNKEFEKYDLTVGAHRVENIVRTNSLRAFNQARLNEFAKQKSMISGYQFSAIMDGRTSEVCTSHDGKKFSIDDGDRLNPPLHYQCRSVLVPIYFDEVEGEFQPDKLPQTEKEKGGFLKLIK